MKKIISLWALGMCLMLSSCLNDEIEILGTTVVRVDPSTIMTPFSYQITPGDLDGVDENQQIRIRLFAYDEAGVLFDSEEQYLPNYLTSATFNLNLKDYNDYTIIALSDVVDSTEGSVAEYWSVSDEQRINSLKVNYEGSDSNYGSQEILGIASETVRNGKEVTINLQAAGALVCSSFKNLHAYPQIHTMLLWGSRGNGYFDFSGNQINANPDLESYPDFLGIDVPNTPSSGLYSYKFLMPQTNYQLYLNLLDANNESLYAGGKDVELQSGHEYLCYVEMDPNGVNDGTFLFEFLDVTGQQSRSVLTKSPIISKGMKMKVDVSASDRETFKSYKVKDLL